MLIWAGERTASRLQHGVKLDVDRFDLAQVVVTQYQLCYAYSEYTDSAG